MQSTPGQQTDPEMDPGTDHLTDHQAKIIHSIHHKILDQITEAAITQATMTATTERTTAETTAETEITNNNQDTNREIRTTQTANRYDNNQDRNRYDNNQDRNRYDNNQDRNRFDNRRRPNKCQHHRNQHKAQVIFEFSDQNIMEMMQMVRGFINLIKANPTTRDQYKSNKLATHKYDNEVNESEIQSSSLEQVQQFFNEDSDVIFDALVAAEYIDEIECTDGIGQQQA